MSERTRKHSTVAPDGGVELVFTDYEKRIKELEDQVRELNRGDGGISAPMMDCTPNFDGEECGLCECSVARQTGKREGGNKGIEPLFKYRIPTQTDALSTWVVETAIWDSADLTHDEKIAAMVNSKAQDDDITDDDRISTYLQTPFKTLLKEDTDYYVVLLVAKSAGRAFAKTPPVANDSKLVPGVDPDHPGQFLAKFHTKKIIPANPEDPNCDMIVTNKPHLDDTTIGNALLEFKFNVDKDGVNSVEDLDVDRVVLYFLPVPARYPTDPIPAETRAVQREIEIGRDNLVNPEADPFSPRHLGLKIPVTLSLGDRFALYKIKVINAGGKAQTEVDFDPVTDVPILDPLKSCIFWAGGKVAASDAEMPIPSITDIDTIESRNTDVSVLIPNTTPVLLKFLIMEISYDYDGVMPVDSAHWKQAGTDKVKAEEEIQIAGTHTKVIGMRHHKNMASETWYIRARLNGLGKIVDPDTLELRAPRSFSTPVAFNPYYGVPLGHASFAVTADIASAPNTDTESTDAIVSCIIRCFASHPSDNTPMDGRDGAHSPAQPMSFKAAHCTSAAAILYSDIGGSNEKHAIRAMIASAAERNATSITAKKVIPGLGDQLYWVKSRLWNGDGHTETVMTSPVSIRLGGVITPSSNADVPALTIASTTASGNRMTTYNVQFTQTTPRATLLKKIDIEISVNGGPFEKRPKFVLGGNESYHVPGTTYTIPLTVSHPANLPFVVRFRLVSAGFFVSNWINSSNTTTAADSNITPSTTPTAPSTGGTILITNTIDGDPSNGQARIKVRVMTANGGTFAANHISEVWTFFRVGSDTGEKKPYGGAVPDSSQSQMDIEFHIPIGTVLFWLRNKFVNGDQFTETTGSVSFTAGLLTVAPGDPTTVPTGTIISVTPRGTNKRKDTVVFRAEQHSSTMIELAEAVVEQDDGFGFEEVWRKDLRKVKDLFSGLSATKSWTVKFPREAASPSQYRMKQIAVGGKESSYFTFGLTANSNPEAPIDTGAPSAPTVTKKLAYGVLDVFCTVPSSNALTRLNYQVLLSTQNTPPVSTPTVGSEGVVAIILDPSGRATFLLPRNDDNTTHYYVHARVGNAMSGTPGSWGFLDVGVRENFDRPLDDYIGSGVIQMPTGTTAGNYGDFNNSLDIADADIGWQFPDRTGAQRRVPFRIRHESTSGDDIIEVWMPTGENAYSLKYVEWAQHRGNSLGAYKGGAVVIPGFVTQIRVRGIPTAYRPMYRIRFNNQFRGTVSVPSDGWGDWSYYVEGTCNGCSGGITATTYDPENEAPPSGDLLEIEFMPERFVTF